MPLLEVENLKTYFYGDDTVVKAVDGISYNIEEGETVALVGESGCGKSVSSLSILGLIPSPPGRIVDGEVRFRGTDLIQLPPSDMRKYRSRRIAMVFQEPMSSLNPVINIETQLTEGMMTQLGLTIRQAKDRALELLETVGISDPERRLAQFPHEFSGGMRQRVMIAIALSCEPDLIIADEPTTSLDVTIQAQILDLMQTIPPFVYLIPTMIMFGLGVVPGLISTVIFAIPAPIRLTHLGISSVPRPLVEAGEAFGATRRQLLWKVELPHAMPTIMAGVTQCIMLSLSMVVIAAMVGAPGLGVPVLRALNTVNIAKGFEAGLAIVIVAILLDRICKQRGGGRDRG